MTIAFTPPVGGDPLFPSAALLPLSDTRGGDIPLAGTPGPLRPLSATLGIVPIECGKLECNPAGQYLWLEHATGLPISAGIAALLAKGTV